MKSQRPIRAFRPFAKAVIPVLFGLWLELSSSGCRMATAPEGSGSIAGRVALFDSTDVSLSDFFGTTVSIDHTSLSTTTDPSGYWMIDSIPNGVHDITATKPGFGTFHWYEQNVNNGKTDLRTAAIARMTQVHYTLKRLMWMYGALFPVIDSSENQWPYRAIAYCDLDSNVQPSDAHLAISIGFVTGGSGPDYFSIDDLRAAGARPGQTLYISMSTIFDESSGQSNGFEASFFDPVHNQTRWASTGQKSNVIAVTMP